MRARSIAFLAPLRPGQALRTKRARPFLVYGERHPCERPRGRPGRLTWQGDPRLAEVEGSVAAPVLSLRSHRLNVAIPLEVEGVHAQLDGAADLLLRFVVGREATYRIDLPTAVAFVLLGVQLRSEERRVGKECRAREAECRA